MQLMLRVFLATLFLLSPAYAQKTKSVLQSEITTSFPDNATGAITPAVVRGVFSDFVNSWQQYSGLNKQAGTSYAFVAADYGQLVQFNNANPVTVTLAQASGSFSTWNSYVENLGAGAVTITPATSTICGSATVVLTQFQSVWVVSDGTNYQCWFGNSGTQITYPISNANLALMNGNTVKANPGSSPAAPSDFAMPSCNSAGNALQWTTNSGFGCGSISSSAASGYYTLSHVTGSWVCTDPTGSTVNTSPSGTANTHTTTTVDNLSINTNKLTIGEGVSGSGIAGGTTILAINSSSSITLTAATSTSLTGTTITFSSTTDSANECMQGAAVAGANFKALCLAPPGIVPINATGRLRFPPVVNTVFNLDGCLLNATGDIGVQINTLANGSTIHWSGGEILCTLTGGKFGCVDFIPTSSALGIGAGIFTIGPARVTLPMITGICSATGAIGAGVIFDSSAGSAISQVTAIFATKIEITLIDGFDGTHNCFVNGISTINPPNLFGAFGQNNIYVGYIQGFSAWGIKNGTSALSQATQSLATNHWEIGTIGSNQDGASVSPTGGGIQTFGFLDYWYANVSTNNGTLPVGFTFAATTANGNFFVLPQLAGTTKMTDSGTTNFNAGYCNGKVNFTGTGAASC